MKPAKRIVMIVQKDIASMCLVITQKVSFNINVVQECTLLKGAVVKNTKKLLSAKLRRAKCNIKKEHTTTTW